MTMIVSVAAVREYLQLEVNNPTGSSRYTDATIGSNILAAQAYLERETHRFLVDRTAFTWICPATMLRAQVPIPGFRSFTSVIWGGATLPVSFRSDVPGAVWAIPDDLMTGQYVALQFRAWRADSDAPWWLADRLWFDKLLDSPFYPGNRGGGFAWTSMPDDLIVTGNAGYALGSEPYDLLHATKVLAGFFTMRPASILADVAITPSGGVITYSSMPAEVRDFIGNFKIGTQVASV